MIELLLHEPRIETIIRRIIMYKVVGRKLLFFEVLSKEQKRTVLVNFNLV